MNFKPVGDRYLVRPDAKVEETESGIFIPGIAKQRINYGEVIEVSDDNPWKLAKGDRVVFTDMAGTDIELEGEPFKIMLPQDIFGTTD